MIERTEEILTRLFSMQDLGYRAFQSKLIPTVLAERVIGVRTPQLRKFAKSIAGTPEAEAFLKHLPHTYYEEDMLHAFLIERIGDFDRTVVELDRFLPYVDNWAVCDSLSPPVFFGEERLLPHLLRWTSSSYAYAVRYGIVGLMRHFLTDRFQPELLEEVARVRSEEYYVNMAIAWYFATALATQYSATLPYLTEHRLSPWIHAKTIQKAIESYRVPTERKEELKKYRKRPKI
jgi:3-methyladenine DNA glycosylase AlkD